jgi:cytochrome P450
MGLLSWFRPQIQSSTTDAINVASPEFKRNAYDFYARLRAEAPAYYLPTVHGEPAWLITRYDDVAMILKDERFTKDRSKALTPEQVASQPWFRRVKVFRPLQRNMLDLDPPDHTRLRALVSKAFTAPLVEQLRGRIGELSHKLLDKAQKQRQIDLIRDYALPLPATIIAELLGVPARDQHRFHRWSNAMTDIASTWGMVKAIPSAMSFLRYIRAIVKERRSCPKNDLVSALAKAEEAGDRLSEDELLAMIFLLLVAGHETTVNLIGNGTLALLEHTDECQRLRKNPALIKSAVEEFLRYSSPVEMATERYAREDVTIAGVTIPRGVPVFAVIASANRDEQQFSTATDLVITREPNKHLSFGLGAHYCLGAPLARLEGQIAINTLLQRLPDMRLAVAPESLHLRSGLILRGLKSLPVTF